MRSLSTRARVAGVLYIASAVGVVRLVYVPARLFVTGNAAATANNIAAHETLFRWGMVSEVLGGAIWLFVPLALYQLFKNVDRPLAILTVILGSVMQAPTYFFNSATDGAALLFVRGPDYLSAFTKPQRDALAMVFLRVHHQLDLANMFFAGAWLIPFGLLVYRSRFIPRVLGVWLMLASIPYFALCFGGILRPGVEDFVFAYGQPLMFAEVATMLWLAIAGARSRTPVALPRAVSELPQV